MFSNKSKKNNKEPTFKKTLTKTYQDMDKYRILYLNALSNERALKRAQEQKPLKHSNYYKQAFLNNYESYYKNGGKVSKNMYDYTYKHMTGSDFNKKLKK